MAYNNIISRTDVTFADQKLTNELIKGIVEGSAILPLMRKLPNMTGKQARVSVLSSLPEAYWVDGDEGLKQTTNVAWKNKYINAEEIAVVVPIADAVLADSEYDVWAEIKPLIVEQFYKKIDQAIITGTGKPSGFRAGLIPSVVAVAGHEITVGNGVTLYDAISDAMSAVEESGYDVNGILGGAKLKGQFRKGLLDTTGQPIANNEVTELPRYYSKNGAWDNTYNFLVGDFSQAVYAIRSDIEFKLFDSGVITDGSGNILYNLMQQDMKALRVTMRLGWELPNPVNALDSSADSALTRFPFAVVKDAVAGDEEE